MGVLSRLLSIHLSLVSLKQCLPLMVLPLSLSCVSRLQAVCSSSRCFLLSRGFMVRATWLLPQTRYSDTESRAYISLQVCAKPLSSLIAKPLGPKHYKATRAPELHFDEQCTLVQAHAEHSLHFKALQASTLEITLAQFWSSLGDGRVSADVYFHGIELQQHPVLLDGACPSTKLIVR